MSELFEVEKRKGIVIIAAAAILASALGAGLAKVGSGFAARAANGITVTGSAKTSAKADNVVWTLNVSQLSPTAGAGIAKVNLGVDAVNKYLLDGGIKESEITLGALSSYGNEEWKDGNSTGRIVSYRVNRDVTVRTKSVDTVFKLSQGIGSLIATGVPVNNYGPQYLISTLSDLRPQLLAEAMKDAKVRAEAITKAVGGSVGNVTNVRSGVIQVTTPDSTQALDSGAYDTSTIDKTVTATVSVTFQTK